MSNQLQATRMNGTSMPNKNMNHVWNSVKISIIVLSMAIIPLAYHFPTGFQYGINHTRQRFLYHDFTLEHLFPNLDPFVSMGSSHSLNKREKILKTMSVTTFDPSTKILSRIMKVLMENNAVIKTILLRKANLNHIRLSMHLDWLDQKGLIQYVVMDNKVNVTLTEAGREFAKPLVALEV